MSASFIGLLISLIKLAELIAGLSRVRLEQKQTSHAILTLQNYKQGLEKALLAKRQSRIAANQHNGVIDERARAERLPDDGYRRD